MICEAFENSASACTHAEADVVLDDGSTREAVFYAVDEELQKHLIGVWDCQEFRQDWLQMCLDDRSSVHGKA